MRILPLALFTIDSQKSLMIRIIELSLGKDGVVSGPDIKEPSSGRKRATVIIGRGFSFRCYVSCQSTHLKNRPFGCRYDIEPLNFLKSEEARYHRLQALFKNEIRLS